MLKEQTRVKHKETGKTGVIGPTINLLQMDGDHPLSIFWDGAIAGQSLNTCGGEAAFEDLGPENAAPDPVKCGAGQGEDCCIFLTAGAKGFECERYGSLRYALIFRKEQMHARREPKDPYPGCFLSEVE